MYDNCPGGVDYTPSRTDGQCGTAPVVYDNCPGGVDYTPSNTDGSCGTAPVTPAKIVGQSCTYSAPTNTVMFRFTVDNSGGATYTVNAYIGGRLILTDTSSVKNGWIPYTTQLKGAGEVGCNVTIG